MNFQRNYDILVVNMRKVVWFLTVAGTSGGGRRENIS